MCILLNVKKHEKTFALNVDIFRKNILDKKEALVYSLLDFCPIAIGTLSQKVPYELSELFEVLEDLIQKGFVKETIPNYYIRSL